MWKGNPLSYVIWYVICISYAIVYIMLFWKCLWPINMWKSDFQHIFGKEKSLFRVSWLYFFLLTMAQMKEKIKLTSTYPLWKHHYPEWRECTLRDTSYQKLFKQFNGNFICRLLKKRPCISNKLKKCYWSTAGVFYECG